MYNTGRILFCGALLFFAFTAEAGPSLTATPLVITTDAEARDIKTYDITLTNTGTQPLTVYPSVNNISLTEGGNIEEFKSPAESDRSQSLSSWIEVSRAGITLEKGASATVTVTLRVNPNPLPGEYHAYLGFGWGTNRSIAEELVRKGLAPGTVVTVNIVDEKNELLRLSRFFIDKFVTSANNQSARYTVNNPGDETLSPHGEIIFYDNKGVEIAALPVNPEGATIPPGEEREFEVTVPTEGLFGKYKAFLSVEYGSQRASVQDTTFFYVMPFKTLGLIVFVVILVVIIGAYFFHKRFIDGAPAEDADHLSVRVREAISEPKEHDIDLKRK